MKKIVSVLLLALLLTASLLSLSSCGFQNYTVGVTSDSDGSLYMKGSAKKDFDGYVIDVSSYNDANSAAEALLQNKVSYLLLEKEDAQKVAEQNSGIKCVPYALTDKESGELMLVALSSDTAFDACASAGDVETVLGGMQKSEFQVEWELFYNKFITQKGYKVAIEGLATTMQIAVFGLLIGIAIGTLIALVKMIPKYRVLPRVLSAICDVYVGFFRGTPMVVQLLIGWFILLPALDLKMDNTTVAVIVFGMNSGAYVSEIMRSGIQAVDAGQLEAARALGLGYWISMIKVVIPQGVKNILPTLGNEFIVLVKDTSIVSFIAVVDITKAFRQIGDANYSYIIPYLMLALIYLVIVMLFTLLIKLMERRLAKSERRK